MRRPYRVPLEAFRSLASWPSNWRLVVGRRWWYFGLLAGVFSLGSCSGDSASEPITVLAGINDPEDATIAVTEYLPESITVSAGTTVTWLLDGPEPHTVSFVPLGQSRPPQFTFSPLPPQGPYDGTTRISSGLVPRTEPVQFSVEFSEPGEYSYFCAIHPRMNGTVTVTDGDGETQEEIDARAEQETQQWLAEGRAGKADFLAQDVQIRELDDGSTNWTVEMGTETEHTSILAYSPETLDIEAGDTVTFINPSEAPHTATFLGGQPPAPWWEAQNEPTNPDGAALNPSDYFNTGEIFLVIGKGAHAFSVPEPGAYSYVCLFHLPSQMVGSFTASG